MQDLDLEINVNKDLYGINSWGEGFFGVNSKGHVTVQPSQNGPSGDLYELVKSIVARGIEAPILIRFDGIIRSRISFLQKAFHDAIQEFHYRNTYQAAYPIKVNQQRTIVDLIHHTGRKNLLGLEVGSKPELIAVLSILDTLDALLLCNGYKDAEYIELALLASKLGRRAVIIIEQFYELKLVLEIAERLNIEPEIGFRMKPATKGSGRWKMSGGDLAKFGLNIHEIVLGVELLKKNGKTNWLKLLHFHIGSQVTSIDSIKKALNEATRIYTELAKECQSISYFDVGGGLGVDYEGSRTNSDSSMNYTVEEYARDVVSSIGEACLKANIPDPIIITESGRALVAHHSVLITEVIDVSPTLDATNQIDSPPTDHELLANLFSLHQTLTGQNCHEVLHDALEIKEKILQDFIHGSLSLVERAYAERTYRHLIAKIRQVSLNLKYIPGEIINLDKTLYDLYFCNFSVFQSLPDAWAIDQLFPIMPIHRLDQEPTRRAIIADLSCDSDGKIDHFINRPSHADQYIKLHEVKEYPYYIGIFLVGAYQEILGGLHNLFGDTNAVHVDLDEEGNWELNHVIEGDQIREVLSYVQYDSQELIERLRLSIEKSLKAGRMTNEESAKIQRKFRKALDSYTYLVV